MPVRHLAVGERPAKLVARAPAEFVLVPEALLSRKRVRACLVEGEEAGDGVFGHRRLPSTGASRTIFRSRAKRSCAFPSTRALALGTG